MRYAFVVAEDINLGAGYIIAHLKEQGHEVKLFFDPIQCNRGYSRNKKLARIFNIEKSILRQIKRFDPHSCLFSSVTASYQWALNFAEKVKKEVGCKIIFGGIHATLVPEEARKHTFIDEVVIGDGLAYFGGSKFDPDSLWPERESFLKQLPPIHRKYQLFMTSFGCPFNCSFCGNEQLRKAKQFKYIRRSREGCINELKHLKERGMKHVLFVDDIFTCDRDWLLNFLPAYKRGISLPFAAFGHVKYLDERIVEELAKSGCRTLWLGIQSGDERLRKQILNRHETNKEIINACKLIKKYKIKLMVDHIFGIPMESEMSQEISYALYQEIQPDVINCYELVYFPKAKIIEHALKAGNLTPDDVLKINRGEGITYQVGNKNRKFYDEYAKGFIALPVGGLVAELLPVPILKLIAHCRAGRGFIAGAMIQNELWFGWRALCSKLF